MSGDMTIRRIEDLDSTALTYAEVKAIASGNPLVIEKAQVDAELMKLTVALAHAEEQYRIRANLRHSHEEVQRCTERLTNLQQDLAVLGHFRRQVPHRTGRADARQSRRRRELLLRRAGKSKTASEQCAVGKFAGFDCRCTPHTTTRSSLLLHAKTVTARGHGHRARTIRRWNPSCRDSRTCHRT